nr:MAG TPA: hypothetical protein [Inoviridae sp.]
MEIDAHQDRGGGQVEQMKLHGLLCTGHECLR